MQLRQAQTFRVFDNHQARVRHVDTDFNDRRGYQQVHFALLESLHHRLLFRRFHPPVHQTDIQLRQRQLELLPGGFRRLGLQQIGLFDEGTDPIGLAAFVGAGVAHAVDNIAAPGVRDGDGGHRGSARRQLVDNRGVQIGVGGHRQGAGDRRGGHDQLMRVESLLLTFLPQRQPLMHAEAVLFVDNHQRQAVKLHLLLEDGVGADNHLHLAAGDSLLLRLAGFAFLFARQPADFNTQRFEPVAEVIGMLLGKQFGGRHQRHLFAVDDSAQGGQGSDQRFTGANVALHQAHHRHVQRHIALDLGGDPRLRAGGLKGQGGQQLVFQGIVGAERQGVIALGACPQRQHAEVMRQQLFQNQTLLRRVLAAFQLAKLQGGRRAVQRTQRLRQAHHPLRQLRRQEFANRAGFQELKRLIGELAQGRLLDAFGGRIDWG